MNKTLLSIAALAFAAAQVHAASIPIVNPGFESDPQGPGGWSDAVPTGWNDPAGGSNGNFLENIAGFASDGVMHLGFDASVDGGTALVYQDLSTAWAPNTSYTLTVGVGNRDGLGAGWGLFGFGSSTDGAPSASVYGLSVDTSLTAPGGAGNVFADLVLNYTTGAVAPAGNVRLFVQRQTTSTARLHVDNFRLDGVAVPEPSSLATLGLAAGLLMRRRRA